MKKLKCPICGKPVPPSKGVKPRKYCSYKCTQRASQISAKQRCYRKPKSFRKVCALCGEVFFSDRSTRTIYCSRECANNAIAMKRSGKTKSERLQAILDRRERKRLALENCRETAPITIEYRGNVRIETRGPRVIGCRAADHIHHS